MIRTRTADLFAALALGARLPSGCGSGYEPNPSAAPPANRQPLATLATDVATLATDQNGGKKAATTTDSGGYGY
jgi:hypothetical protein